MLCDDFVYSTIDKPFVAFSLREKRHKDHVLFVFVVLIFNPRLLGRLARFFISWKVFKKSLASRHILFDSNLDDLCTRRQLCQRSIDFDDIIYNKYYYFCMINNFLFSLLGGSPLLISSLRSVSFLGVGSSSYYCRLS